jgi:methyl-accepting chemotaxis protein
LLSTTAGGVTVAILLAAAGFFLVRSIASTTRDLVEGAERLGSGALDHRLEVRSSDEMGQLAAAFNQMADNLKATMVSAQVEREARERIERLLDGVRQAVGDLTSATAQVLSSTAEQAAGAQEQAAAVSQTVSTASEVSQTTEQAAERARNVSDLAQRADTIGRAGAKAVEDAIQVMSTAQERADDVAESIVALAAQTQAIGEIIAAVNDIAEQTNLLALNAAIEAARAGEQGKGFAVVATEVKALADQSKKATVQVRQILGEIQKTTNAAVVSTEQGSKSMHAAVGAAKDAGETIRQLMSALAAAARSAAQISASAGQQATGVAQILQAMKNINEVAAQTLGATRETERAMHSLGALGERLQGLIAEYGRQNGPEPERGARRTAPGRYERRPRPEPPRGA